MKKRYEPNQTIKEREKIADEIQQHLLDIKE